MSYSGEGNLVEAIVSDDVNKTVVPLICDSTGKLLTVSSGSTTISGPVSVSNFPISQAVTDANVDKSFGTWGYYGGSVGTVVVGASQRVLSISCHSTTGGTLQINGGAVIPIPANVGFAMNPLGNLTAPTVVYTGTDSYFIEVVS